MARDGVADVAFVNPGYQAGRFPIIAAAALPFLIANGRGGTAAVDEWYRRYAPTEMKDVHYCLGLVDNPGTLQAKTKVTLPTDLRGMKLRPPTDTMSAFIALVGGTNIHVAAPETHEALARGVADATFMPWDSLTVFGLRNVTYYHIDLPIFTSPFVVVLNEKTYRALAPDQRKAIDSNCDTAAAVRMATPLLESSHGSYVEIAKDPAHHVYKLTRTEIAAWRAAAAPLAASWEANAKKAGIGDPAAALDALRADLKKDGALLGD
jgi:TRAP-type C4-dicarboxylate transport system substrate-binding protein